MKLKFFMLFLIGVLEKEADGKSIYKSESTSSYLLNSERYQYPANLPFMVPALWILGLFIFPKAELSWMTVCMAGSGS